MLSPNIKVNTLYGCVELLSHMINSISVMTSTVTFLLWGPLCSKQWLHLLALLQLPTVDMIKLSSFGLDYTENSQLFSSCY